MAVNAVPTEVERFITEHIGSVAQLEILLLVHSRAPEQISADAVARELRIEARWADNELHGLAERGILTERSGSPSVYAFAPRSKELTQIVDAVRATYEERRVTVIDLIFKKPIEHARAFAEAFRLRRS